MSDDSQHARHIILGQPSAAYALPSIAPGRVPVTARLAPRSDSVQRRVAEAKELTPARPASFDEDLTPLAAMDPWILGLHFGNVPAVATAAVQRKEQASGKQAGGSTADAHAIASRGVSGSGAPLPYLNELKASFGQHGDVLDGVRVHTDATAVESSRAIGADAYATGTNIAFAVAPTRELVGHEAAHIVQQRAGVSLSGGVGAAGDPYEQHADRVGAAFALGESVEHLLSAGPTGSSMSTAVQRRPAGAAAPTTKGAAPDAAGSRLTPITPGHDFGQLVVGAHLTEQFALPWNTYASSRIEADAWIMVSGDGFTLRSPDQAKLPYSGTAKPANVEKSAPRVVFEPKKPGAFSGSLLIVVKWEDGHVEMQTMALTGRARGIEDVPERETPAEAKAHAADDNRRAAAHDAEGAAIANAEKGGKPVDAKSITLLDDAADRAAIRAALLAQFQQTGSRVVEGEAAGFRAQAHTMNRSAWWDLAELALTIGVAGLAGALAKAVLPRLVSQFAAAKVEHFSDFTTDALKEGMKQAGKKAIASSLPSPSESRPGGEPLPRSVDNEISSNPRINFFAKQEEVLAVSGANYAEAVLDRKIALRPLLATAPEAAIGAMDAMRNAFDAAHGEATQIQARAVSPQWATLVARSSLGTTSTPGASASTVTDLTGARQRSQDVPESTKGLLNITLTGEHGTVVVVGAKMNGIAQSVADRFAGMTLTELRMPIRFVVGEGTHPTVITRDESGRVRVVGDVDVVARQDAPTRGGQTEAQAIRGAELMIARVMSRSLRSWGVEITTNDVGGDH